MIIAFAQDTKFSVEEWQRRLDVHDLWTWYDWYRQQAPEKHTNLNLEIADMTKEEEAQLYNHQQEAWEENMTSYPNKSKNTKPKETNRRGYNSITNHETTTE